MSLTHHMTSVSCLHQNFKTNLAKSAAAKWNASCRGKITVAATGPLPSPHFARSIARLSRRHAGLYVQLRFGHVALTAYVHGGRRDRVRLAQGVPDICVPPLSVPGRAGARGPIPARPALFRQSPLRPLQIHQCDQPLQEGVW